MKKRKGLRKRNSGKISRERHEKRIRGIARLGLILMLSFTLEYIAGGQELVQKTLDTVWDGVLTAAEEGKQRLSAFREAPDTAACQGETIRAVDGQLKVHFLDVGQADCILIQEGDASMLIDAGNNEDGEYIAEYIRTQGIGYLNYVIGTHPHADHIGGLDTVLEQIDTGEVLLPDKVQTTETYEDVLDVIEEKEIPVILANPGMQYMLGDAEFTVIAPLRDYGDELNNWSVGIRLVFGNNCFVMTGDAQAEAEQDMVESGMMLQADVWKAAHHGSDTSNSSRMLNAVRPSYAVISCGKNNSYGHPDASVLESFAKQGIQVFRTDEQGTVIAESNGTDITWNCEPY